MLITLLELLPPQPTPTVTPPLPSPNPYLEPSAILTYIGIGVAAVLTIIGIFIMWRQLYYGKKRQYKELSYSKLADVPLVSVDTRAEREKIQIFYDKKEVKDIRLVLLKVWNSGTQDTKIYRHNEQPDDPFETPYWFIFEGRTVIARSVLESEPPSGVIEKPDLETYRQNPDPRTNAISLPHCLLKPKKAFTLRVLLTGPVSEIKTEGQLVDCELKEYKFSEKRPSPQLLFVAAGACILLVPLVSFILTKDTVASLIMYTLLLLVLIPVSYWFVSLRSSQSPP
jgi:hypothetical protein